MIKTVVSTVLREWMPRDRETANESGQARALLIAGCVLVLGLFLFLPLAVVFVEAFRKGWAFYAATITSPDAQASIWLTARTALVCVPLNTAFGVAAAWLIGRFQFVGRSFLITLIDLPYSVSPVVAGLAFTLLLGSKTAIGAWFAAQGLDIIFAWPGIVVATTFVTFPFVARELIPLMEQQGSDDEEAALTLGASSFQMFWTVTLPNIKWGLLTGVLLCNARAMGEFGAVAVVSGHVRGLTNTLPLQVEALYQDYDLAGAFAVATLLAGLALLTLLLKTILEWRLGDHLAARR